MACKLEIPFGNMKGTDYPAYKHSLISATDVHCLDIIKTICETPYNKTTKRCVSKINNQISVIMSNLISYHSALNELSKIMVSLC